MSVLDVFRLRKRVPTEHVRTARKQLERALDANAKAANEFQEAIDDLLKRMDKRKGRRNAKDY